MSYFVFKYLLFYTVSGTKASHIHNKLKFSMCISYSIITDIIFGMFYHSNYMNTNHPKYIHTNHTKYIIFGMCYQGYDYEVPRPFSL